MSELKGEAERLRASGALGRSSQLTDLFEFLLNSSEQERSPKESDIALTVFGRGGDFDPAQDALVRVHMHRLRAKLDQYYTANARPGAPRLVIPKGEYRLMLEVPVTPPGQANRPFRERKTPWQVATLVLAIGCVAMAVLLLFHEGPPPTSAESETSFWKGIRSIDKSTLILVGDRFLYAERGDDRGGGLLVLDSDIGSADEFDERRMLDPNFARQSYNPRSNDMPVGVAVALRHIMPVLTTGSADKVRVRLLPLSQMTPDMMRAANIVYIGHLADLGILAGPVFAGSHLSPASGFSQLTSKREGTVIAASTNESAGEAKKRQDFGYISTFPGPSGNRFVIISGGGDAGLMQAAEVAGNAARLSEIMDRAGNAGDFEAVLDVSSLGNMNVGSRLLLASPLDRSAIWRSSSN